MAAKEFKCAGEGFMKWNLFAQSEAYAAELRTHNPHYRKGYAVASKQLKPEFGNIRSLLTKAYANGQWSWRSDKDE